MFAIITTEKQQAFERSTNGAAKVPEICGYCGRACRQMNKAEGANRALCIACPLAEYVKPTEQIRKARKIIESRNDRSSWGKGVTVYALEMLDDLADDSREITGEDLSTWKSIESKLLNGADDWSAYSWGGCALIYNVDIAERLCCPSELKKTRGGERRPNGREEWLDVQARALHQAANRVCKALLAAKGI